MRVLARRALYALCLYPSSLVMDMICVCTLLCICMPVHVFPLCVCVCVHASRCSLQHSVFIYSCSQYVPGTAALRPASPEAKECPLFLLLLLPAPLTLLAHALSGAAGTSAQPRPSRPAGRVGRMNPTTLTWTGTRSGSWERIHNGKMRGRAEEERSQRAFTSFFTKISEGSPAYS